MVAPPGWESSIVRPASSKAILSPAGVTKTRSSSESLGASRLAHQVPVQIG